MSKIIRLPRSLFTPKICSITTSWQPDYFAHPKYMQSPRDREENRYCWQGKHNARELREGDPDADEGSWWERWHSSGRACKDLGCKPVEGMVKDVEKGGKRVKV